jgi:hypothetical protein
MSVLSVKMTSSKATSTPGGHGETREYIVLCGAVTDTAIVALAASGIPVDGAAHPDDPTMFCSSKDATYDTKTADPWVYNVTANFKTPDTGSSPQQTNPDPDDDDVIFSVRGVEVTYPMHVDAAGTTVLNSAGDSFDDPPKGLHYDEEITVTVSQTTIDPDAIAGYRGKVNSASFTIIMQDGTSRTLAAHSCRMGNISYEQQSRNGVLYWKVTYPIMWRDPTDYSTPWKTRVLDEGYRELSGGDKVDITMNGKRPSRPLMLDGSGTKTDQDPANAFLLEFLDYTEIDFGTLSLTN